MFKRHLLSSSIAVATAFGGFTAVASAQNSEYDAEFDEASALEEVVVTGVRASLEKGLDIKRDSYQIVDSIVAEDIGKFPDNNVVEALQRVTGVQVTDRGAGEVNTVSIRGLTDVTTTVNGRQIFTAAGRAVALADVPASLLKGVDVIKTRSASQLESGIAGQIDIHTQRPFDFDNSKVVFAGRGIYQEQSESADPNLSGLFSGRWDTSFGEVGALLNVSYAETNYRDQSVTAGAAVPFLSADAPTGWQPYQRIPLTDDRVAENPIWTPGLEEGMPFGPGSTVDINGQPVEYVLARDAVFASDFTGKRERPAANISLQWAPNDTSEYLLEGFYNGYRNESFNSLNFAFVDSWADNAHLPRGGAVEFYDGTNIIKARDVSLPGGFTSGDLSTGKTDSYLFALGGKWDLTDTFRVESELYYQSSEYQTDFIAMRTDRDGYYGVGVDFNAGNGLPAMEFYDDPSTERDESDLTDTAQWKVGHLYDNGGGGKGESYTLDVDGEWDLELGWVNKFDFGLRHDVRTASETTRGQDRNIEHKDAQGRAVYLDELGGGAAYQSSEFFDDRSDVPTEWVVANGHYLYENIDKIRALYGLSAEPLIQTFEIEEATTSVYAQGEFAVDFGSMSLDGQFGVRYITAETEMEFADAAIIESAMTAEAEGDAEAAAAAWAQAYSYADTSTDALLPSLVVRWHITDDLMARFAYTETLGRPGFNQLNSFETLVRDTTNIGYGTGSGGNPNLQPVESQNLDLTLEWYFADSSALYGTLFRRNIEGFVYSSANLVYRDIDIDGEMVNYPFILTRPDNTSEGVLQGLELGFTYFPDNLPELLDGFGIQASYTALDSEQLIPVYEGSTLVDMVETPMFGVSDSSYSAVLAYDKNDLDMRLSYVWRDDFLNNYEARSFANPLGIYRRAETSLDFQASYDVMDNLTMTFDATNLLDDEYQSYYEYPDLFNFGSAVFSRTFALGARYSF